MKQFKLLLITVGCITWLSLPLAMAADLSCQATYFPDTGKLFIPCVDAPGIPSQAVIMQQISSAAPWQFVIEQRSESQVNQENLDCQATYLPEQGELRLPCVNVLDSAGKVQTYEVMMAQSSLDSPTFTVSELNRSEVQLQSQRSIRKMPGIDLLLPKKDRKTIQDTANQVCNKCFNQTELDSLTNIMLDQASVLDIPTAKTFTKIDRNKTPIVLNKSQKDFVDKMLDRALNANSKNAANKALLERAKKERDKAIKEKRMVVK